jgi:hypothetical protein
MEAEFSNSLGWRICGTNTIGLVIRFLLNSNDGEDLIWKRTLQWPVLEFLVYHTAALIGLNPCLSSFSVIHRHSQQGKVGKGLNSRGRHSIIEN